MSERLPYPSQPVPPFRTSFQISPDRHTAVAVTCNGAGHETAPMADELRRIWS